MYTGAEALGMEHALRQPRDHHPQPDNRRSKSNPASQSYMLSVPLDSVLGVVLVDGDDHWSGAL